MRTDREIVRDLVRTYLDVTQTEENDTKRQRWQQLNSMQCTQPLIHIRGGRLWTEVPEVNIRECGDPHCRQMEAWLRLQIYRAGICDDTVFEPWLPCRASFSCTGWGLEPERRKPDQDKGAWKEEHPLKDVSDLSQLREIHHVIDEDATAERLNRMEEIVGDLITIDLDRSPVYQVWDADLATALGHLRGIQELMMDMYDAPDALHALLAFMRDGVLRTHREAEAAGDWGLSAHDNQSMSYDAELDSLAPNVRGVRRKRLWCFLSAQELTLVSPEMHDVFMLQYQLPILKEFGLAAYGCCEDLTNKINMLRQVPNLRRIAVAPLANVAKCADQIGTDYVISYRPNPAEMVCVGFDEDRIRRIIGDALRICSGQYMEINLKDVHTVQGDPTRLNRWVQLVRETIDTKA